MPQPIISDTIWNKIDEKIGPCGHILLPTYPPNNKWLFLLLSDFVVYFDGNDDSYIFNGEKFSEEKFSKLLDLMVFV